MDSQATASGSRARQFGRADGDNGSIARCPFNRQSLIDTTKGLLSPIGAASPCLPLPFYGNPRFNTIAGAIQKTLCPYGFAMPRVGARHTVTPQWPLRGGMRRTLGSALCRRLSGLARYEQHPGRTIYRYHLANRCERLTSNCAAKRLPRDADPPLVRQAIGCVCDCAARRLPPAT